LGRYLGPVEKLSRREGVDLGLKGERALNGKGAMERRPFPPGQHGRRRAKVSEYAGQLREKQKAKRLYWLREKQFGLAFARAGHSRDFLGFLELRLDNVLYRLGFATTRAQARQFVVHGHVQVNDRKVDRPSYLVQPDDRVSFKPGSRVEPLARQATELVGRVPDWLLADHDQLWGLVKRKPDRDEIEAPIDERLVIELHSK
jgi:small subunit ribosomal protein S4